MFNSEFGETDWYSKALLDKAVIIRVKLILLKNVRSLCSTSDPKYK